MKDIKNNLMIDYLLSIPARYQSKRLPGKPLLDIKGFQ